MPNSSAMGWMRSQVSPSQDRPQSPQNGISVVRPDLRSKLKQNGHKAVTTDASATSSSADHAKILHESKIIRGVPSASETLPKGLQQYDIIKRYPNHLHGELLLDISATWQPKEISELSGIKANTLVKRIRAAKVKYRGDIVTKKKARKEASKLDRTRQTNENRDVVSDGEGTVSSSFVCGQQPLPLYPGNSEASRKFLLEQENNREELMKEQKEVEARGHQKHKGRNGQWYSQKYSKFFWGMV